MSKKAVFVAVAAAFVVVAGLAYVGANNNDKKEPKPAQQNTEQAPTTTEETNPAPESSQDQQPPDNENVEHVSIKDSAFSPASITVKKGTTVTWTNEDSVAHTVTPDQESAAFQGSGSLSAGESFNQTFNAVGTYTYHCTPHPHMTGT